jgi:hypothetical protein
VRGVLRFNGKRTMLYIKTLQEMKEELGVKDSEDDTLITDLLEGLQARFDDFLERTLLRGVDVAEIFDGGALSLATRRFPVESVSAIYIDEDQAFGSESVLTADDYRVNYSRGRIVYQLGSSEWPDGFQNIKVVYTGGFVATDATATEGQFVMPVAVRRALSIQASFEWRNRRNLGQQSVSGQGVNISLAPAKLLPEVQEALWPFKRF